MTGVQTCALPISEGQVPPPRQIRKIAPGFFKTEQTKVLYENAKWVDYISDRIPLHFNHSPSGMWVTTLVL